MEDLTKKQKGFVQDYVETGNGVQSALKNYDTDDYRTANAIAVENLQKPAIQNAIKSIADSIPDKDLIRVHKEGLEASKKVFKNNNESGEIELVGEEPDYAVRHKYLDSAYKLKGVYAPEKSISLNLNGDIIANDELESLAKQLNDIARHNNRQSIPSDGVDTNAVDAEIQS